MVEFALVLPVLLAFLLGTVTVGTAYDQSISMNNAARESSRYGAVRSVESDLSSWLETVADVAVASATGDLDAAVSGQFVCVAYVYPDGTSSEDRTVRLVEQSGTRQVQTGQTCFSDGRPSDERRVQVQLTRDTDIEAVIFSQTITLNASSVARFERLSG
jgi:Flp pilus assembly protein TadG